MANYKDLYEKQKDQQITDGFKDLKDDIKGLSNETRKITEHVSKINGRLSKVERKVFPDEPQTVQQLPPIWRDTQILKLLTYIVIFGIVVAVIIAGLKGYSLPTGIF